MSRRGLSMLIAILLVIGLATASVRAQETAAAVSCDRYASPTGSDSATGAAAAPFQSAVKLAGSLSPGQTGCFRSGVFALNDLIKITTREIVLTSYPGERAKIVGRIWVAPGADGVRVENLDLDGRNPTGMPSPTVHAHDTVFRGNDVTNAHTGICFNLGHGSYGRADRTLIEGNRIHHCGRLPATNHDHGIYVAHADRTVIRGNWIYANADRGVQLYPDADGSLVVGNVIDANGQGVLFSGGTSSSSDDNVVENNVIVNSTIRYNIEDHWQGPRGVGNVARNNCVWTSGSSYRGDSDDSGIEKASFTASSNVVAKPSFVDPARGDYTVDPDSSCGRMLSDTGPPPTEEPPATTAPQTTITSGPSGTIATDTASFGFSSSEPDSSFECRLDGATWAACTSLKSYSALAPGEHTFEVRATDAAGTVDQSPASAVFVVDLPDPPPAEDPPTEDPPADSSPPETTITSGPSGTITTDVATFGFASSESESSFECRLDGAAWTACTSPHSYAALGPGAHNFAVRARDAAGNVDQTAASRGFKVKLSGPTSKPGGGGSGKRLVFKSSTSTIQPGGYVELSGRIKSSRAARRAGSKAVIHRWRDGRWKRFTVDRVSRRRFEVTPRLVGDAGNVYFRAKVKGAGRSRPVGITVVG
ncbi:MAG: right-handed parallel beta-helix repeat-containing protein [Solirubrobacterales bacterium]